MASNLGKITLFLQKILSNGIREFASAPNFQGTLEVQMYSQNQILLVVDTGG